MGRGSDFYSCLMWKSTFDSTKVLNIRVRPVKRILKVAGERRVHLVITVSLQNGVFMAVSTAVHRKKMHRKCEIGYLVLIFATRASLNPTIPFYSACWPRKQFIVFRLGLCHVNSLKKIWIEPCNLSPNWKMPHNLCKQPRLQKNKGKRYFFNV